MNKELAISKDLWQSFVNAFNKNPEARYISWNVSDLSPVKATLCLNPSERIGLHGTESLEKIEFEDKTKVGWSVVTLKTTGNTDIGIHTSEVLLKDTPIQPGDMAAHATLGLFVKKSEKGRPLFVTAWHAAPHGGSFGVGVAGKKARVIDSDQMIDVIIARFEEKVEISRKIKKADVEPRQIANNWLENQRFGLVGSRTEPIGFARAVKDNAIVSWDELRNARHVGGTVILVLDKFEVKMEEGYKADDGDSGGPVLLAKEDENVCTDMVAGIMVSIYGNTTIVTKMDEIAKEFRVILY